MPDGYAEMDIGSGILKGEFLNGQLNGKGTIIWKDGRSYTGDWVKDKWDGKGIYVYSNGDRYEGEFKPGGWASYGLAHGKGTFIWVNGDKYVGQYKNDKRDGYGVYTYANGDRYEGSWKNSHQLVGTEYQPNGDIFKLREYFPETGKAYGDYLFKDGTSHNDALFINGKFVSANVRKPNGNYYKTELKDDYVIVETNHRAPLETIGNILGGIINVTLGLALIAAELESGQSYSTAPTYKEVQDCKYMAPTKVRKDGTVGLGRYVCRTKKVRTN